MGIWKRFLTPSEINEFNRETMQETLGLTFTEVGENYLVAELPVDSRTKQPYGILHGGASVVLAESLGSMASNMLFETPDQECLGIEISANHIKAMREGKVVGRVSPIHLGKTLHVWDIRISAPDGALVCVSRLTVLVRARRAAST
jgi:1,4-dihydroxy-2-naphthoyl-CoA hydrolase